MDGKKKLEELVARANAIEVEGGFAASRSISINHDTIRSISDAYKAMGERAEKAEAALAIARPAILEEAAKVVQGDVYNERYRKWLWWSKVGCRGEEDEITQFADKLAAHLRALAHTTGQEGGR